MWEFKRQNIDFSKMMENFNGPAPTVCSNIYVQNEAGIKIGFEGGLDGGANFSYGYNGFYCLIIIPSLPVRGGIRRCANSLREEEYPIEPIVGRHVVKAGVGIMRFDKINHLNSDFAEICERAVSDPAVYAALLTPDNLLLTKPIDQILSYPDFKAKIWRQRDYFYKAQP